MRKGETITLKTLQRIIKSLKKSFEDYVMFKLDISRITEFFPDSIYETRFQDKSVVLVMAKTVKEARAVVADRYPTRKVNRVKKLK